MKRIAILQSNYIPWKGYFDIIAAVDEFVVYDCVQYTKNDWRNRNQIKTPRGKAWLTIPVRQRSLEQTIERTEIADSACFSKHWSTFRQNYAKAPHIGFCAEALQPLFQELGAYRLLSQANVRMIRAICELIGISTRIRHSGEFELFGDRNERLVNICRQAGASYYLSGTAAKTYLDESRFAEAGVVVEWMSYDGYAEYPQLHPPFDHYVSVLDLIASVGSKASEYMLHARRKAT
ncbi:MULTISPECIES: WbqC family protein [unclassified Lysobacter]|uniref:WbqC family protein n=1 Tax=unclassified Lysobacter TaxID=2635362 RepID=UPI001F57501D|nr:MULTISPECIES: WbqC family protein [unclassified Lysobacter]